MYIQKQPAWGQENAPLQIPENYSGTTVVPGAGQEPPAAPATSAVTQGEPAAPEVAPPPEQAGGEPTAAAFAEKEEKAPPGKGLPLHALVSRFPVLSSLLPPKKPEGKRTQTSDLALILGVLLLLAGEQDDILPILLVLLLA